VHPHRSGWEGEGGCDKGKPANALRTNTSSAANAVFLGSNAYDPVSWVASLHHGRTGEVEAHFKRSQKGRPLN
jgi:hypothetical protein